MRCCRCCCGISADGAGSVLCCGYTLQSLEVTKRACAPHVDSVNLIGYTQTFSLSALSMLPCLFRRQIFPPKRTVIQEHPSFRNIHPHVA